MVDFLLAVFCFFLSSCLPLASLTFALVAVALFLSDDVVLFLSDCFDFVLSASLSFVADLSFLVVSFVLTAFLSLAWVALFCVSLAVCLLLVVTAGFVTVLVGALGFSTSFFTSLGLGVGAGFGVSTFCTTTLLGLDSGAVCWRRVDWWLRTFCSANSLFAPSLIMRAVGTAVTGTPATSPVLIVVCDLSLLGSALGCATGVAISASAFVGRFCGMSLAPCSCMRR